MRAAKLAALAKGRLKAKYEELVAALDGQLNEQQRRLLQRLLAQIGLVEDEIAVFSRQLKEQMQAYETQLERLDTISGVGRRSAENILAEIGPKMAQFPTDDDLVSWGALCPGKDQSAGKARSRRIAKGNRWLKRALIEAGWGRDARKG